MTSLFEVVLTFVAIMLVLALAAQSLLDVVKFAFALKGQARVTALRRLLREAAAATRLGPSAAEDIAREVLARLNRLSQRGLRPASVRLDVLDKTKLMELVRAVDPEKVQTLEGTGVAGQKRLGDVACEVDKWFELAWDPVSERYRRRMRLGAIVSAAAVVLAVNANAFDVLRQARGDPQFRAAAQRAAGEFWTADSTARVLEDSARRLGAAAGPSLDSALQTSGARRETLALAVLRQSDSSLVLGYPAHFKPSWKWGLGILIATLLVSLGAPFWHDVLKSVFGLKNRILVTRTADGTAGDREGNGAGSPGT